MNNNQNQGKNNRGALLTILLVILLILSLGSFKILVTTLTGQTVGATEISSTLRFDNVNEDNIVYLITDKEDKHIFKLHNTIVASASGGAVSVSNEYLKELNLYGYVGPITLMNDMSTYNDGEAYFSDKFRVTINDNTPVEFIHNLASSNKMYVVGQQEKSFTVVFRKKVSLTEYKNKMNEFKSLKEISSVEKIYLAMENADDTNDQ